ncbi:hypothetical protein GTP44_10255 [Duganella sp. FT50W]|uniref:Uncharacterized protein n=1 Tax=Duganella lactea TaxID=2692173 RepID=A0A6L8MK99_9BURK|nr:hypothetical protein [Duganella lactea]MYM82332.1 hypothetical protein [Duganella lactea]
MTVGGLSRKQCFGLIAVLMIAAHYFYFRVPFVANDYGSYKAEWPLLVDMLISLPLLYYFMFRPTLREFLKAWLGIAAAGVLVGRLLIPAEDKQLWRAIEGYWLLVVVLEVALELYVLMLVLHRVQAAMRLSGNADEAMERTIRGQLGASRFVPFAVFEMRVWYYGLFMRRGERLRFRGEQHFSYDKNDGNVSNQFAFLMVMLFEMPLMHMFLHLALSKPRLAWTLDILSLMSMLYLLAEYRASLWRPISLDYNALLIRNGVLTGDREVAYGLIEAVVRCEDGIRRQRGILRFRQSGRLNVEIRLRENSKLATPFGGEQSVSRIYLSLDHPDAFIDALRQRL